MKIHHRRFGRTRCWSWGAPLCNPFRLSNTYSGNFSCHFTSLGCWSRGYGSSLWKFTTCTIMVIRYVGPTDYPKSRGTGIEILAFVVLGQPDEFGAITVHWILVVVVLLRLYHLVGVQHIENSSQKRRTFAKLGFYWSSLEWESSCWCWLVTIYNVQFCISVSVECRIRDCLMGDPQRQLCFQCTWFILEHVMIIKRKILDQPFIRLSRSWIVHRPFSASWFDGYGRGLCFGRGSASYPFGRTQLSQWWFTISHNTVHIAGGMVLVVHLGAQVNPLVVRGQYNGLTVVI